MRKVLKGLALVAIVFATNAGDSSCSDIAPTSDQQQGQQQEEISQRSNMAAGMPNIYKFSEKKLMKQILEERDAMFPTYTYLYNMNGTVGQFVCNSFGYGLPYATQYDNPEKVIGDEYHSLATMPQADPNGLFSPSSADGTWVLCADPTHPGVQKPVYLEPRIIVSPFPLKSGN